MTNIFKPLLYSIFIVFLFFVSLPLQTVIAAGICISTGWPIIYLQERIGKKGRTFWLVKFRTMVKNADRQQGALLKRNEASGPVFKIRDDPRFTPVGKFLSHTGLDELPQLWNVLKGEMAIIGPRPLPVEEAAKLTKWQKERHKVKPGIISPWIVQGYHKNTFDIWMKSDLAYIKKKSFFYDMALFVRALHLFWALLYRETLPRLKHGL
jgi:lipopolysaccharide/colanic/teichoic acid biosynthesis glycosyltransferase